MAHLAAYTRKDMGKITKEAYREHTNQSAYKNNVDLSKSHLNYSMAGIGRKEFLQRLDARCIAVMQGKKMQSQTKVIGSWVFTVPDEIKGDETKEKKYFEECYAFTQKRYGKENVIDGVVHYDEGTPHMTVYTVPATVSRKTGEMTISKASLFTRTELKDFHPDLDKHLEMSFGVKGLALNGRTKGDYTLEELKERTRKEIELSTRETAVAEQEQELIPRIRRNKRNKEILEARKNELDSRETDLKAREAALASERETMRLDMERQLRAKSEALEQARTEAEQERDKYRGKVQDIDSVLSSIPSFTDVRSDAKVFEVEVINGREQPKRKVNAMGVPVKNKDGRFVMAEARPLADVVKEKNALHDRVAQMRRQAQFDSTLPWEQTKDDSYSL